MMLSPPFWPKSFSSEKLQKQECVSALDYLLPSDSRCSSFTKIFPKESRPFGSSWQQEITICANSEGHPSGIDEDEIAGRCSLLYPTSATTSIRFFPCHGFCSNIISCKNTTYYKLMVGRRRHYPQHDTKTPDLQLKKRGGESK